MNVTICAVLLSGRIRQRELDDQGRRKLFGRAPDTRPCLALKNHLYSPRNNGKNSDMVVSCGRRRPIEI